MSFVVYFLVLVITVGSVAFGLDWLHAPMSPMPHSAYELHAAKAPEPPKQAVAAVKADEPKTADVKADAPQSAESKPTLAPQPVAVQTPPPEPAPQPIATPEVAAAPPPPKCDIAACQAAYFTFTPSDCTYQPSDGPRRLCTKGNPPSQTVSQAPAGPDARAQAACNVSACSQAYISFTAADCTYQPLHGPRQLCTK